MANRIFFSWQSDTEKSHNTNLLRGAIQDAIKKAANDFEYDEATRKQIGSTDIADELFKKIRISTAFIADVTTINKESSDTRKHPNPNVLIELGFASGILGWNYIIPVFNLAKGNLEDLPFDIRNRRVLTYRADENANIAEVKKEISNAITSALKDMDHEASRKRDAINRAFVNQSEKAKFYALNNEDDYWHSKLLRELLTSVINGFKMEYDLIDKGVIFKNTKQVTPLEFWDWIKDICHFQVKALKSLDSLTKSTFFDKLNSENALEILHLSQTISRIGDYLIQRELEKRSLSTHEKLEPYIMKLGTNLPGFVLYIERIMSLLQAIENGEKPQDRMSDEDARLIFNLDQKMILEIQEITLAITREETKQA